MDKQVIIFVTLRMLNLLHTVDNYNKKKSTQYITNVSAINHRVLWAKLKVVHSTHFYQNFELFAITDFDEVSFSNLCLLN